MGYNRQWIDSLCIQKAVKKLASRNLISPEQEKHVNEHYVTKFYSPNIFVRIGLFIFTFILSSAAMGLFALFVLGGADSQAAIGIFTLIGAVLFVFVLEQMITAKNHYRSGIDDCLLYLAVSYAIAAICIVTDLKSALIACILSLPLLAIAAWRYADRLITVLAFVCAYAIIFLIAIKSPAGKLLLPFILMIVSGVVAWVAHKKYKSLLSCFHRNCLLTLKVLGLLCFYFSVNYFVVREGNAAMESSNYQPGPEEEKLQEQVSTNYAKIELLSVDTADAQESDLQRTQLYADNERLFAEISLLQEREREIMKKKGVPLQALFYLFTFLLPLLYIYFALKYRDKAWLLTSLFIFIFAIFTYKYYFSVMPLKYALTFGGIFLIAVAYFTLRYLKTKNTSFTGEADNDEDPSGLLNAEALLISQSMGKAFPQDKPNGMDFGGGKFGGGGAGGSF